MSRARMAVTLPMLAAWVLAGCDSPPDRAGFADVRHAVAEREGKSVEWHNDPELDEAARRAVASLLQNELTADEAVQIALLNNRELQATFEALGIAQAEVIQAGLPMNPVLIAELRFPSRPRLPFEIDITQEFLDLLLLPLRKRVAGAAFEEAQLRVSHAVLDLSARARSAFYELQAAEQARELRQVVSEAADASAEMADRLREAGNTSDLDLSREVAMRHQARIALAEVEARALDEREELNALLGLWGAETQWAVAPRLPDLPAEEIPAEGMESLAVSQRLDLAAARKRVELLAESLGLAKASALTTELTATGHYEREPEGIGTAGPSISLGLPIFNRGQGVIARAEAEWRQSRQRFYALAVEIRAEVRRFRNRMLAARERVGYYRQAVMPLQERIVEQAQLQYNAMQIGVVELLRARQEQVHTAEQYVETLRQYWVARTELERSVGGRLQATVPDTTPAAPVQQLQEHGPGGHP